MNTPTSYSVADARVAFADILNRVAYTGEVVTILKYGEPVARMIPVRSSLSTITMAKYFGMWRGKSWAKSVGKESRRIRKNRTAP